MQANSTQGEVSNIIFFDGVCGLCNGFVDFVLKRDHKKIYYFSTLQGSTAKENGLSLQKEDSVVLKSGSKYYFRSTAALKILISLGGVWKLMRLFYIVPIPIRDFVYNIIASVRYKVFGKTECRIPSPEERSRFLP